MNQTFSIRVWHKLLVLGLIAAVLCAVPTSLYVIASNKDIRSALQEIKGLNPATKLVRTTQLLQAHRGYAAAILSGNAALSQQRLSTQKEVTAALADVRAALPATATPVIQALDKVNAEWDSLSNALKEQGFPVEDSYNRHTKLIGGLMNVLEINLDFHGLTLDPEASTSYLINAAFQDLPRLIESLGRMRATGTAILGIKQATTEERVTIATMLERSRQDLEHSGALIRKAVEANGAALPAIEAATAAALSETQKFLAVTDLEFMRIEVLRYNPEDYQKMGGAGIDAQFKLIDTSRTEIEHMLNERVSNYRRDRSVLLGMIAILALFGAIGIFWIARSITRPLAAAIEDANAIAAGRLDSAIQNVGKGEVGQLRLAMKQMQQNLAHIVFSIRENSESVATASREIASSTRDMSARVESQASSLEETAASMEELNSTFHKNDESSQHVTDLAAQAAEAAEQGGTVVGKATRTMQEIDVSSKKIAEIIAVIDGIAFQTNILALNAAVEAARAGEQGRGFAVVASEVRALAQRSGQASKEIRALISDSVKKVQAGTREAVDSGKVMDEILASVRKVAATMKDMQTVRGDQRRGVSQVSQAVEQMNQGTQQSAAMVEQIAATADMLSDQAQDLNEAVAVFKLSGEEEKGRSVKRNDYATGTDTDDGFTEAYLPDRPISKSIADALPNGATRPMLTSRPH